MLGGGVRLDHYVVAEDIRFGDLHAPRMDFLIIPDGREPSEIGGFLGQDVLQNYDVEIDFAGEKLNLFSPHHCKEQVVYWTKQPYAQLSFSLDKYGKMSIPVTLDNKSIRADIAIGTSESLLSLDVAKNLFGWSTNNPNLKTPNENSSDYHYPFKSLVFGDVTVSNPDIALRAENALSGSTSLIIGMGILRQMHIYMAFKEKNIYFTSATAH
jgi:hypothetical protein